MSGLVFVEGVPGTGKSTTARADTVCSTEGYELLRRIPDHRWVVYDGQPHNITNAVPERCAADLRRFLVG
jgi:pimeloyl-ACP methyl ester carboxylesterase